MKRAWLVVALVTAVALACAVVDQAASYVAYRRLGDLRWTNTATAAELRLTAHRALGLWLGDPHDAFLVLRTHGDHSSVPYLRAALAREPSGDALACTWIHGEEALARLSPPKTGETARH